ncbi:MAG TPA: prephenate dehydrogenase/arogenate dehydrogenase family protein [Kiritimatiellia bacterium]|nr:prephenate dehydrogenase/arogenate dehydrogenase family protein [Kiritimatiellia bacterium]MBP9571500.1 prephenate dehydrogenase/arogenate dehydrogenase family protein [Kiritimatiellia bacterium]HQF19882.1 prephenate dehydrogenase/arogenate dehydrogenase family protein [Kiritimatiellia bacterium]HQG73831.1 prephenate dehydrogenase/arogenate dehydrogenase family protein [Kiritimatiellia bacterium]HXK78585.1 prephenate dehydrogenase/arogenate dehydrogenase family protein [Kiritimatiellia bacte
MTQEAGISIVGLGLMGASLAMALRKRGYAGRLVAYARREETRQEAVARGIVDAAYADPDAAIEGTTLIVLCVPIRSCVEFAGELAPLLQPGMLVTDVGSTKSWICRQMAGLLPPGTFVGSHPIAGSEKQGLQAASADLYANALTVLCSHLDAPEPAVARVAALWQAAGARTCRMEPDEHDRLLARTSHLPHVAAAALAKAIGRDCAEQVGAFCGTGFYDSTRVASGSIDMWHDILLTNAAAVAEELRAFKIEVEQVYDDLQAGRFGDVAAFLERARVARAELLKGRGR